MTDQDEEPLAPNSGLEGYDRCPCGRPRENIRRPRCLRCRQEIGAKARRKLFSVRGKHWERVLDGLRRQMERQT